MQVLQCHKYCSWSHIALDAYQMMTWCHLHTFQIPISLNQIFLLFKVCHWQNPKQAPPSPSWSICEKVQFFYDCLHNFAMTYHLASNSLLQNCWRSDSDYPDATLKFEQQPSFLGRWQTQKPHWNRWEMLASDIRKSRSITLYCRLNSATVHHFGRAIPTHPPTKTKTNCRKKERGQHKVQNSVTHTTKPLFAQDIPSISCFEVPVWIRMWVKCWPTTLNSYTHANFNFRCFVCRYICRKFCFWAGSKMESWHKGTSKVGVCKVWKRKPEWSQQNTKST